MVTTYCKRHHNCISLDFTFVAKHHIWPAIGNQHVAWVGRQGFLEKILPVVSNFCAARRNVRWRFFCKNPKASEVKRSEDLADLRGIVLPIGWPKNGYV